MDNGLVRQEMKAFVCKVPFGGSSAPTIHVSDRHKSMSESSLDYVATLSKMPKHKEIKGYRQSIPDTLYAAPGRYKRRFLNTNSHKKKKELGIVC